MSIYEWESGKIVLPTKDVAPLKKILRDQVNTFHSDVRAKAVEMHKSAKTTSIKKYGEFFGFDKHYYDDSKNTMVENVARDVLRNMWENANAGRGTLHVPTVADVSLHAPKMTTKDNHFRVLDNQGFDAALIHFNGRVVAWAVEENNHAVDHAYSAPLARSLFKYLHQIEWTRGTGGHGVGNNEMNTDSDYVGGGANYVAFSYGPLGVEALAQDAQMSKKKYLSTHLDIDEKKHADNSGYERSLPLNTRRPYNFIW